MMCLFDNLHVDFSYILFDPMILRVFVPVSVLALGHLPDAHLGAHVVVKLKFLKSVFIAHAEI